MNNILNHFNLIEHEKCLYPYSRIFICVNGKITRCMTTLYYTDTTNMINSLIKEGINYEVWDKTHINGLLNFVKDKTILNSVMKVIIGLNWVVKAKGKI